MDSLYQKSLGGNFDQVEVVTISSKYCVGCKCYKPVADFGKGKNSKDKLARYCKVCTSINNKKRRSKKPDKHESNFRYVDGVLVEKRCGVCKEWKSVGAFGPNGKGYRWLCRKCDATNHREARKHSSDRYKDTRLRRSYGITLEEYNAMLAEQNGVCKACGHPEFVRDQRTGTLRSLAVDHCHVTGAIRGLLCQGCNQALGALGEDPARARALAEYIEKVVLY